MSDLYDLPSELITEIMSNKIWELLSLRHTCKPFRDLYDNYMKLLIKKGLIDKSEYSYLNEIKQLKIPLIRPPNFFPLRNSVVIYDGNDEIGVIPLLLDKDQHYISTRTTKITIPISIKFTFGFVTYTFMINSYDRVFKHVSDRSK